MPDTTTLPITTAGWLRRWREGSGLSQAQVAARLGILQSTVSRWERGYPVALDDLRRLVRIYEVPVVEAGRRLISPEAA
jgi:transcriptional regulator with XRE-family HTH domain